MKIIEVMIVTEIILVNVITIARCCKRKYKHSINILVLLLFSLLMFRMGYYIKREFTSYSNGNGLFAVFGFLYLIPLKGLYKEKISRLFVISCMAWVYTLGIFALAVQISKTLDMQQFHYHVLLIETILFLGCSIPYHKIIVKKYIYILENTKQQRNREKIYISLSIIIYFFTLVGTNFIFSIEKGSWAKVMVIFLLMINMLLMYNVLYQMVRRGQQAALMDRTAHYDELTGLRNRLSMLSDLQEILSTEKTFSALFLDLDKFKHINDAYGHVIGDQYLQHFARIVEKIIGERGRMYRFGGDEFFVIYEGIISDEKVEEIELCKEWSVNEPCPFNSVSVGVQICEPPHMNIEELLERVDKHMYQKKMEKVER